MFEEKLTRRHSHNGGDGTSASSVGTASPDIFQGDAENTAKDISKVQSNGVQGLRGRVSSDTSSRSELSDINENNFNLRKGSSNNDMHKDSVPTRGSTVKDVHDNSGFESGHSSENEDGFSMGRDLSRKSLFIDHPLLERWSDLQDQRIEVSAGTS